MTTMGNGSFIPTALASSSAVGDVAQGRVHARRLGLRVWEIFRKAPDDRLYSVADLHGIDLKVRMPGTPSGNVVLELPWDVLRAAWSRCVDHPRVGVSLRLENTALPTVELAWVANGGCEWGVSDIDPDHRAIVWAIDSRRDLEGPAAPSVMLYLDQDLLAVLREVYHRMLVLNDAGPITAGEPAPHRGRAN